MKTFKKLFKILLFTILTLVVLYGIFSLIVRPSLVRDWNSDQAVLAHATFDGHLVKIDNIRNVKYRSTSDYDVRYYDKSFDLDRLESVWYMVEPFAGYGAGAAHTLVSFGFEGGDFISISAEIRKEKGESFSVVKGLFRQYEIVYVVADERDVVKLRSNFRRDEVFLYPVNTTKERMRTLLVSMLERANTLAIKPEFYNTLTNTCTTNIVSHVNEIVPGRVPWSLKVLMPAYSDELAYKVGLIGEGSKEGAMSLEAMRVKYKINERAEKVEKGEDEGFSRRIRNWQ